MLKVDASFKFDAAAAIEAAAESILITTAELDAPGPSIVYVNPAFERITGWSRAEVVGKSPRILQGPKTDHRIFADLEETLHSAEIWEGRTINYRKDGSEFWMEWSIVPLRTEEGRIYQYVAIQLALLCFVLDALASPFKKRPGRQLSSMTSLISVRLGSSIR